MDEIMKHIMLNAGRAKRSAEDAPLDLRIRKIFRHTHDSFVHQEDLRSETFEKHESFGVSREYDIYYTQGTVNRNRETEEFRSLHSVHISNNHTGELSSRSDQNIKIKREAESTVFGLKPHSFMIADLIINTDVSSGSSSSADAVVYSSYSHPVFGNSFINDNKMPETNYKSCDKQRSTTAFWCHTCNVLCMDHQDARAHQYLHSVQGAKCNLKKSIFYQHGYVTQHEKLDDEKMKCGLCDKIVAQCFFTKHQRLHDGHFCDDCNHEFSTNSRLHDHMNIHNGNTAFTCTICDRKFSKRSSLTQHQRYHRDHQSFKCNYCKKSFSSKYARAVHERLHTGNFPFKCHVSGCTRAFPQKIQLTLHLNSHC